MLQLAVKKYLKSIQDNIFVPNPDNAEWTDVNCLDVAIKRRPRWIWQRNIYTYNHFGLINLLNFPCEMDKSKFLKHPKKLNSNFLWSTKNSIHGKLEAKIMSLLSLDFSVDDIISINVNIDDIEKQSIDYAAVAEFLKNKKVNLDNQYIRRITCNKDNVICLITQYIYVTKPFEIQVGVNWNISHSAELSKINIKQSIGSKSGKVTSITFNAGTRLAFKFSELYIKSDGSVELLDGSENFYGKKMIPYINIRNKGHIAIDSYDDKENKCESKYESIMRQIMLNKNSLCISKTLLSLAHQDKASLNELELFFIEIENQSFANFNQFQLSSLNISKNIIFNLISILTQAGCVVEKLNDSVDLSKIDQKIVAEILIKMQAIYHLETAYVKNMSEILDECNLSDIRNLISYLKVLKEQNIIDKKINEDLLKNKKIKSLLLSIGVIDNKVKLNKYFEPTLILLCGS